MKTRFDDDPPGKDRYGEDLKTDPSGDPVYPDNIVVSGLDKTTKISVFGRGAHVTDYEFSRIENGCYVVKLLGITVGVKTTTTAEIVNAEAEIEAALFD